MFFVDVETNHQPKNLKCGGCTWYQPAEIYTYVRSVPDTYGPGISRLPRYVYDTRYVDTSTRYVCTWYQPATQICMYLVSAGRRTFHPWTHTSDDSYMYQLSLVVATATASSGRAMSEAMSHQKKINSVYIGRYRISM